MDADDRKSELKGWLTRKAGFLKTKYWFWLFEDKLMYSRNPSPTDDTTKCFSVDISSVHQVRRTDSPMSFEIVSRKEHFSLVAGTQAECDDWVRTLQAAMQYGRRSSWSQQKSGSESELAPAHACVESVTAATKVSAVMTSPSSQDVYAELSTSTMCFGKGSAEACLALVRADAGTESASVEGWLAKQPTNKSQSADAVKASADPSVTPGAAEKPAVFAVRKNLGTHMYEEVTFPDGEGTRNDGVVAATSSLQFDAEKKPTCNQSPHVTKAALYEEIVLEDDVKNGNGAVATAQPLQSGTEKKPMLRNQNPRVPKAASYEEIVLEDDCHESGGRGAPTKRFSIVTSDSRSSHRECDASRNRVTVRPRRTCLYKEVIAEDDVTASDGDCRGGSARADAVASEPGTTGASEKELKCSINIYEDVDFQGCPALPDTNSTGEPAALYSAVMEPSSCSASDQQTKLPQSSLAARAGQVVMEATGPDDNYAVLREDAGSAALSLELSTEEQQNVIAVRSFAPQPYSHAVSALKEFLIGEGAFAARLPAYRLAVSTTMLGSPNGVTSF